MAQTIAAALGVKNKKDGYLEGGGYLISWCVGHLVQLSEAAAYGEQYRKWSYESLPILPEKWQYTVSKDKETQFNILKELMHRADVSEVVNACDAGREGELIFRFVYEVAGCKKPIRRLWISSMEDGAIRSGFDNLKDGREYDALFASALCRAKADWIIGINATRLFSCLYNCTLNVGRVQTPTLKMLADRDAAISTFKKEKYYHVRLALPGAEAASAKIRAAEEAEALKAACEAAQAVCVSVAKEKKTAAPPKLFDLTSLQREANRIYGYTAKQTLDLAQSLYEKRLLTYPRTDSSYLTDDMGGTAADIAALLCGKPRGKTILSDGWKDLERCYRATLKTKPEADDGDSDASTLPELSEGQTFSDFSAKVTEHDTTPPKPHNEASLLSAMERAGNEDTDPDAERRGLGTPATRAAVIEKLVNSGFVERKGKQLIPTKDGNNLVCILPDVLTSPKLTAEWENNLTQIAKGAADPEDFMRRIEDMARELVRTYASVLDGKQDLFKTEKPEIGKCPRCGSPVHESKKNYYCSNRDCAFVMWKNDRFFEERKIAFSPKIAAALLKSGKVNVKKLYSPKTGKTYDGTVVLADTGGKYVNYRVELPKK